MLKEVLKAIAEGKSSVPEIAERTEMQESAVTSALRQLTIKGYLRTEYSGCPRDMPACRNCPIAKEKPNLGVNLCITKKGLKYIA